MVVKLETASGWRWRSEDRARASHHQGFSSRDHSKESSFSARAFVDGLIAADPSFSRKLGREFLRELHSLAGERDGEMFFEGLLALGGRLEAVGKIDPAVSLYSTLVDIGAEAPPYGSSVARGFSPAPAEGGSIPAEKLNPLIKKAQQRLHALQGRGHFGSRAEVLIRQFSDAATDHRLILPMIAGTVVAQGVRAGLWGRFGVTARTIPLSSSRIVRGISGFSGFLAEVTTFAGVGNLLSQGEGNFAGQWKSAALFLGSLKIAHRFSHTLVRPVVRNPRTLTLFENGAGFAGLLAARRLSEPLGLQPQVDDATLVTDTLAAMLSLKVGAHLGQRLLGGRFVRFDHEWPNRAPRRSDFFPSLFSKPAASAPQFYLSSLPPPSYQGQLVKVPLPILMVGDGPGSSEAPTLYQAHRALAAKHQVPLKVWLTRLLKDSGPDVVQAALHGVRWNRFSSASEDARRWNQNLAEWVGAYKIKGGVPLLLAILEKPQAPFRKFVIDALRSLNGAGLLAPEDVARLVPLLRGSIRSFLGNSADGSGRGDELRVVILLIKELGAREAIPDLMQVLDSVALNINSLLSIPLTTLGDLQAFPAIPKIRKFLENGDTLVRHAAILSLGKLQALPFLVRALKDHPEDPGPVVQAMGMTQDPEAARWIEPFLQDPEEYLRFSAAMAMDQVGRREAAIPVLLSLLGDPQGTHHFRSDAAEALEKMGVEEAIPLLKSWLQESPADPFTNERLFSQLYAAKALLHRGVAEESIPVLLDLVRNPPARKPAGLGIPMSMDGWFQGEALRAMIDFGSDEAIPLLRELFHLKARNPSEEAMFPLAVEGLDRLAPGWDAPLQEDGKALLDRLQQGGFSPPPKIKTLLDLPEEIREFFLAVDQESPEKTLATERLARRAQKQGMSLEIYLGRALREEGPEEVERILHSLTWSLYQKMQWLKDFQIRGGIPIFRKGMMHPDASIRSLAESGFIQIAEEEHIPELIQILEAEDIGSVYLAAKALRRLGEEGRASQTLRDLLDHPLPWVPILAGETLAEWGRVEEALPALRAGLRDRDFRNQILAAKAVGPWDRVRALRTLREYTQEPHFSIDAAIALGDLGEVSEATPILMKFLDGRAQAAHREKAAEALGRWRAPEAIPTLIDILRGKLPTLEPKKGISKGPFPSYPSDRLAAAQALARMGKVDLALPVLREFLGNSQVPDALITQYYHWAGYEIAATLDLISPGWDKAIHAEWNRVKTLKPTD